MLTTVENKNKNSMTAQTSFCITLLKSVVQHLWVNLSIYGCPTSGCGLDLTHQCNSMPGLQFPLPRKPFRHNLSYNLSDLQGPEVPHPWPEEVLTASSDENIFTHAFMKTTLCLILRIPVYVHCILVPVCIWSQNRYPCSHVTGGRRIYGSVLFSEQTIGISLYSKDRVELEQLGKQTKIFRWIHSVVIISYTGDEKFLI